jgi:hypothetical protein
MQLITLPAKTVQLILSALQTAAMSPHHPWCHVARSGPQQRCDCHVAKSSRAVQLLVNRPSASHSAEVAASSDAAGAADPRPASSD